MMPTAEESLTKILNQLGLSIIDDLKECIIEDYKEFARLHVEEALKEASEKAESYVIGGLVSEIDKDSILNAYPLENIK